ncbi:amidohydrolase [Anaerovorax odorimutans]|uniref:amidohydrolase n=1 Tax=Anaerovorax odorimutans TaxID=109327 RepID=UPI0003FE37D1|nr:amidohydrolase [Anaerovorax odorimutans]
MKTKKVLSILLCLVLTVTVFTGCSNKPANMAATVLENGNIYTVDGDDWSENPMKAIAIGNNGKILAVGADKDVESYIGDDTKVVDLKGKTVLPGIVDAHVHTPGTALTKLYSIYLYDTITKDQTLEAIEKYITENPDMEEYWGEGFSIGMAGDAKGPKKEWLDEICLDKPIILTSNDGHNLWLNSKAFELNGITKDTPNPAGGLIQKDPLSGELWGTLTDASNLISMEQTFTKEQQNKALEYFQDSMHKWGYTAIMSIAPSSVDADIYKNLENDGKLTMRVNMSGIIENDKEFEQQLQEAKDMREELNSDLIKVSTVKYFADGVIEGMTGYLTEPYDAAAGLDPDYRSEFYWDPEELKTYFDRTMEEGFQIHVHSIGDEATKLVLDAMEYAQEQNSEMDARNVITHLQVVNDADKARFGELGVIAALQPFWHFKEPEWWEVVDLIALGKERAEKEYPVKSLLDNGAILTSSGDHPVSPINNPFWAMETAVTRNLNNADYYGVEDIKDVDDPKYLLNKDERISIEDIIKAYTINGAYQLYREDEIGSLKAGKCGDLVIINDDIINMDPLKIDGIEIIATMFNGKVVSGEL